VRLVDDDKIRACPEKVVAAAFALDVVEANHGKRVNVEDAIARRQIALKPAGARTCYCNRMDLKLLGQLGNPLFDEMGRAEHSQPFDLAAVERLPRNQTALDRLADSDIVGDQDAHRVELQYHQQRHQLIGAWLEPNTAHAAEGARTTTKGKKQCVLE
jgi:hypothetical protein